MKCCKCKMIREVIQEEIKKFIKKLDDELAEIKKRAMITVDKELERYKNKQNNCSKE